MNKKLVAFLSILSLSLSLPLIPASAAVKAGAKCTKAGIKTVAGNKTFTCVKTGKKLVWNKGFAIKPTPTPTPTETKPLPIESNWQTLYRKTLNKLKVQSTENLQIEAVYSPTVNVTKANALLDSFKDALALYVNRFGSNKKVIFLFMSENDKSWYEQKVSFYEGANSGDNWWGSYHCEFLSRSQCGRGTNATPTNLLYEVVGSEWDSSWIGGRVSPNHEAVHVYQKSIIGDGMYRILPPWFGEGQANFLGFVTSARFFDISGYRLYAIKDLGRPYPNYLQFTSSDWLNAINRVESDINFTVSNGLGYSLGMLISEYLYSKFSPDQIDSVLHDVTKGTSWDVAISSNLGLDKSILYKNASEYVYNQVQEYQTGFKPKNCVLTWIDC